MNFLSEMWPLWLAALAAVVVPIASRARLQRRPAADPSVISEEQIDLLAGLKERSADRNTVVNIERFWRNTGLSGLDKRAIVGPLEANGDIVATDRGDNAIEILSRRYIRCFTYDIPTCYRLTDRTWERMVNGNDTPRQIVLGELKSMQIQNSGGGDINGSPLIAGDRGASARVDNTSNRKVAGFDARELDRLVGAMRQDAGRMHRQSETVELQQMADTLADELDADRPDDDKVVAVVDRLSRLADRSANLLTSSAKILGALGF